jgi:hypothetical protein
MHSLSDRRALPLHATNISKGSQTVTEGEKSISRLLLLGANDPRKGAQGAAKGG